jgi:hypothetical protein
VQQREDVMHARAEIDAGEEVGRERIKDRYVRHEQCLSRAPEDDGRRSWARCSGGVNERREGRSTCAIDDQLHASIVARMIFANLVEQP